MALTTPQDLISFSLKAIGALGVGQSALTEDNTDAFNALNAMLAVWNRKRWLIWHLVDVVKVSTGAQSYTVGVGGDFNTPRPDRLEAAFFRQIISTQPNQVDYPLQILESREDYNQIALKALSSFPQSIFYDAAFPLGAVYPWPVPAASIYELHLTVKETLSQFTSLNQTISMPPEYFEVIWTNLCVRLAPVYQVSAAPETIALAKASLATIRGANTQIPRLRMPGHLVRPSLYNVYSDQSY